MRDAFQWMNKFSEYIATIDEVKSSTFDFTIVGGGMGGATSAYALTKKGYKVLLIEKGAADLRNEFNVEVGVEINDPEQRLKYHYWPTKLTSVVDGFETAHYTPTGCGIGGSTRLYAGTLERLEPVDFSKQYLPDGTIVEWPYSYDELQPYYQQVEDLFNVHGSVDPLKQDQRFNLREPDDLNSADQHFFDIFEQSGFHPYRLHLALSEQGGKRKEELYMGALEACILPALDTGNLRIIEHCEVKHIEATATAVTEISMIYQDELHKLAVNRLILAAGAFFTPVLMQRSKNQFWPNGIANNNDLVGRNLMFHCSDYFGIWGNENHPDTEADKSIGFSDLYEHEGVKLGQFQSVGMDIEFGYILYFLRSRLDTTLWGKIPIVNRLIRELLRIPAFIAIYLFKDASVFSIVIEDFPHLANRVVFDDSKPADLYFTYNIPDDLKSRVNKSRSLLKSKIKSKLILFFNKDVILNYGHPCGTCKAGLDPETSVVDSFCKVHDLDNLYIVDASFMPTSGGTNPSITIAANALRVVDGIVSEDVINKEKGQL